MIASDLDGTLINNSGFISKSDILAINNLIKNNITFVFISGRSYKESQCLIKNVIGDFYYIGGNGSELWYKNKQISTNLIRDEHIKILMNIIDNSNLFYKIYGNDYIVNKKISFIKKINNSLHLALLENDGLDSLLKNTHIIMKHIFLNGELYNINYESIMKISLISHKLNKLSDLKEELLKLNLPVEIESSYINNLEITSKNSNKGYALKMLIKKLNINPKNIIVLGDNFNDLSMFKIGGYNLAVENAINELKELADQSIPSNNSNPMNYIWREIINEKAMEGNNENTILPINN